MAEEIEVCALCKTRAKAKKYKDTSLLFCCAGCHAVYQILSLQNALPQFEEHPLFQQAVQSGLISNPDLVEQIRDKQTEDTFEVHKLHLEIQDMWCLSCGQVIYLILMQEKGIHQCAVDYSTDLCSIEYDPRYISKDKIFKLIKKLGYKPLPLQEVMQAPISKDLYLRFIVAAFFAFNIMMFAYPIYASYFYSDPVGYSSLFSWLSFIGSIPVLTYCSWPIWKRFFAGLRVGIWGMEALILIGVSASFGLSVYELMRGTHYVYFDSMTVIIMFVLLGKIIELKAKFSAKDTLYRLMKGLPKKGRKLFEEGTQTFVSLKEIHPGDKIVVLTGEKIVLDGIVCEGEGICDESIMTGESFPIAKKIGSLVLSGSILQQGHLIIKVSVNAADTVLNHIIEAVRQDMGHKPLSFPLADRIVRWFVPLVMSAAFGTAFFCWTASIADSGYTVTQTAIVRAISILLISCPCAIGIAAPLVESHILNTLAKMGVIIRNRNCLAFLGKETVFVFDKTGTITKGKFTVVEGLQRLNFEEKSILKGLVGLSNHPVSSAINHALFCFSTPLQNVEEVIGKGIRGWKGEDEYFLGSASFMQEQSVVFEPVSNGSGIQTSVYFSKNKKCLSAITLGDTVRPDSVRLIKQLPTKTLLLSGDSTTVVKAVSEFCGFNQWVAECSPLQKREVINRLKSENKIVAMIGDGVNDAPALTAAHIGMAVVSATDLSAQVSDLLLTKDDLDLIPIIRKVAKKGHRLIKQNLFWAFFYNVIGIGLAMGGYLSPLFSASAMVLSSFIVLFNAQRVRQE